MKRVTTLVAALVLPLVAAGFLTPASAATQYGGSTAGMPYVAAFDTAIAPTGIPHVGSMQLSIADNRIVGTYTGTSVIPDPLNDRIVPVTGTIDPQDGHVQLQIGGLISFQGTMNADNTISGTANYYGRLYDFVAERGSPGSGK